jgi:hypothetical protein
MNIYSFRKLSTGLFSAAHIVWKLTVMMLIKKMASPASIINHSG